MSVPLAHPYDTITSVITSLSKVTPLDSEQSQYESPDATFPLSRLVLSDTSRAKSALLTLHFLFPNELLPALDILDRQLVTRLLISSVSSSTTSAETSAQPQLIKEVFYVQSASVTTSGASKSSRFQHPRPTSAASYEVRLPAWNCTCPAFAYSAFGRTLHIDASPSFDKDESHETGEDFRFGGTLTHSDETGAPVCKHILAAALGRAAPGLFGGGVTVRKVSEKEAAGWAGGWGD